MRHSRLSLLLPLVLALPALRCSAPPDEPVRLTEKAREQAGAGRAAELAAADWKSAEATRAEAQAMLENRKYREATVLFLKAKTRYEKARDIARGRREELEREIEALRKAADLRCKALDARVHDPRFKLSAAQRRRLEDACREIEDRIATISTQLQGGDYTQAKLFAQTTLRRVWEAERELAGYLGGKPVP